MIGFGPKVPTVNAEDLKKALDEKSDIAVLDVRTPGEFTKGNIKGSVNLPVDTVANEVEKVIPDKKKKVYVYCLSGSRSVHAVDLMIKLGYTNVYDVKSGLLAWRIKQFPLEG